MAGSRVGRAQQGGNLHRDFTCRGSQMPAEECISPVLVGSGEALTVRLSLESSRGVTEKNEQSERSLRTYA